MRLLVQRVQRAEVSRKDSGALLGAVDVGLLVLVGVAPDDGEREIEWAQRKLLTMRVFADAEGKTNLDLLAVGGSLLVVSQFTLFGDLRGGRRPGFSGAAAPAHARALYELMIERLRAQGVTVAHGAFGEEMLVSLVNDGPMTLWLDSSVD